MTSDDIRAQLEAIAAAPDFEPRSDELASSWAAAGATSAAGSGVASTCSTATGSAARASSASRCSFSALRRCSSRACLRNSRRSTGSPVISAARTMSRPLLDLADHDPAQVALFDDPPLAFEAALAASTPDAHELAERERNGAG